jgi:hypothetical protein
MEGSGILQIMTVLDPDPRSPKRNWSYGSGTLKETQNIHPKRILYSFRLSELNLIPGTSFQQQKLQVLII